MDYCYVKVRTFGIIQVNLELIKLPYDVHIPVNKENDHYRVDKSDYNPSIPYYCHLVTDYYILEKEVNEWMKEHKIKYRISYNNFERDPFKWTVCFDNLEDAVLYKITWC